MVCGQSCGQKATRRSLIPNDHEARALRSIQVRADLLSTGPVEEVWGIGSASAAKLAKIGVQTADDLAALDPDNAQALMTVTVGRPVYELRGSPACRWS
jgi:nucleotidyltransferase/DNA polymerase involved in DNA repair